MWIRSNLKENAKVAFKRNYWKCVLVSFILMLCTGTAGSAGSSAGNVASDTTTYYTDDFYEDDFYEDDFYEDDFYEDDLFEDIISELLPFGSIIATIGLAVIVIAIIIGVVLKLLVFGPLEVGCSNFFKLNAYEKADLNNITLPFKKPHYWKMVGTVFLRDLYTALWTLLFIIPGIIKSYEYRMIPFILADCPEIPREDAFRISKEMMDGNKWKTFVLDLSFIGWYLLAIITCNIAAVFYVEPYKCATEAELFIAIREEYFSNRRG